MLRMSSTAMFSPRFSSAVRAAASASFRLRSAGSVLATDGAMTVFFQNWALMTLP
jgi:hypothetical protein